MTDTQLKTLGGMAAALGCKYVKGAMLRDFTTFGTGGKIPILIELSGGKAAGETVKFLNGENIPYFVIGRGSNILADDCDIDRVFLHTGGLMNEITSEGDRVICQAGAALSAVCLCARDNGLTGLEFAYGIPAGVGGAVYMNAGAYGGEIKDVIEWAQAVDSSGNEYTLTAAEMDMSYRHSIFSGKKDIITKVCFKLQKGDKEKIGARMNELSAQRRLKQPLEYRSAGSTFKRPQGAYAAALIEQCGLKGFTVGGAQVSEKHSGFVINTGGATFNDVWAVIEHVQKTVKEQTGYELECEPEIIR
ncbi:MAG: UDP-N-acetylmuramate dehydrogenase [Ruminococcus sp.]|nr:UDP-N-acetylmuramate dehydrogenase [Ruminococcus sp.]